MKPSGLLLIVPPTLGFWELLRAREEQQGREAEDSSEPLGSHCPGVKGD